MKINTLNLDIKELVSLIKHERLRNYFKKEFIKASKILKAITTTQVNTSMEIKEQISIIKQKREYRKIWKNIMNTMWDSRKAYKQQQDIFVIDYYDRIISERHNQSTNTHKLDQLWHQLKK